VREFDAVVGFVDLAGFTAATERLGHVGAQGVEELRDLINVLFGTAIDVVHAAAGEIGWFAGDAMGVVFDRSTTHDRTALDALRRVSGAIAALPAFDTVAGAITLRAKLGVAAGPTRWHTLSGSPELTWFSGEAVDLSAAAEGRSSDGQVVVHRSVFDGLPAEPGDGGANLVGDSEDFVVLTSLQGHVEPVSDESGLVALRRPQRQPPRVARLAAAGDAAFLDEHRPATALFLGLPEATHDIEQLLDLCAVVDAQGGLPAVFEGDKGATLFALFGLPTAVADRHLRAVITAERLREIAPTASIGVASGRVYSGRIGGSARWDYSALGDRINTAARLMQAADPGEVLLDGSTADAASEVVVGDQTRSLSLKGKAEPELVVPLRKVSSLPGRSGGGAGSPFVGRTQELGSIRDALHAPGLTVVTAVAGTGKSRLVGQAMVLERGRNNTETAGGVGELVSQEIVMVEVDQTDTDRPLHLWREVMAALSTDGAEGFATRLRARLADDDRLPLLALLLGETIEPTALTSALDEEQRLDVLSSLVLDALVAESRLSGRRTAVVEDLHWADAQSRELLCRVAGRLVGAGFSLVATARPEHEIDPVLATPSVRRVELGNIEGAAIGELASHEWQQRFGTAPSPGVMAEVVERSDGSPLFCEQLVAFAAASGVASTATELPSDLGAPASLRELVLARVDRLPEAAAVAASYAAVLGGSFSVDRLRETFGHLTDAERITGGVEILRDQNVLSGVTEVRFTHSLLRETAHDRLSLGLLASLHLAAIEHLERTLDVVDEAAAGLARHAVYTTDDERKRRYYRMAGDQAAGSYSNDLARTWYERLVPLVEGEPRGEINLALGEINFTAGQLETAERQLTAARADLSSEGLVAAECVLARVLLDQGRFAAAFEVLDSITSRARDGLRWEDVRLGLETKADLTTMLGDLDRAAEVEADHEALIAQHGSGHPAARPLPGLIPMLWFRGDLEGARLAYESLYAELLSEGDLYTAARVLSDLAGIHYERGDLAATFTTMDEVHRLVEKLGGRAHKLRIQANELEVRNSLGDSSGALLVGRSALASAVELGLVREVGSLLSRVACLAGVAKPLEMVCRSLLVLQAANERSELGGALRNYAELLLEDGRVAESLLVCEVVVSGFQEWSDRARLTECVALARGGPDHLAAALSAHNSLLAACEDPEILVLTRLSLAKLHGSELSVARALQACVDLYGDMPTVDLRRVLSESGNETDLPWQVEPFAPSRMPPSIASILTDVDSLECLSPWLAAMQVSAEVMLSLLGEEIPGT
jgi:class 3 adenylate cyclase/tetratricopeptide (TPR) repeat protein